VPLLTRHLNKDGGCQSVYRGGGCINLLGACRAGWLIARDPEVPARRVLAATKHNLARLPPSLAFEVGATAAGPLGLTWLGPTSWTAKQLLRAAGQPDRPPTEADRARDFLVAALANGPLTSREVWRLAQEQGLSKRTLDRAREQLRIGTHRRWRDLRVVSYWLLPGQEVPADVGSGGPTDEVTRVLAELDARYPPPSPLDEL
jgi:hypothetical protein